MSLFRAKSSLKISPLYSPMLCFVSHQNLLLPAKILSFPPHHNHHELMHRHLTTSSHQIADCQLPFAIELTMASLRTMATEIKSPPSRCHSTNPREKRRSPQSFVFVNYSHRRRRDLLLVVVLVVLLLNILTSGSALSTASCCASFHSRSISSTPSSSSLSSWHHQTPRRSREHNYFITVTATTTTHTRNTRFLLHSSNNNNNLIEGIEGGNESLSSDTIATTTIPASSISLQSTSTSKFGESVPYIPPSATSASSTTTLPSNNESAIDSTITAPNKLLIAITSFLLAIGHYIYQFTHPTTAVSLLTTMEQHSASLLDIGYNGKPTVIDFWAPWCTNCRVFAPTLYAIENEYKDRINFIVVNGDDAKNYPLIQLLGVDSIPHVALLDSEGDVETALIGPVSRRVLRADLDALLHKRQLQGQGMDCGGRVVGGGGNVGGGGELERVAVAEVASKAAAASTTTTSTTVICHDDLPYKMYDAFGYRPGESRRIRFQ